MNRPGLHVERAVKPGVKFLIVPALTAALLGVASPAASPPPTAEAPSIPGYRPHWECREGYPPDTLKVDASRGPVRLLRSSGTWEEGAGFSADAVNPDSVLFASLSARAGGDSATGERYCIVRYASPALPEPRLRMYAPEDVPVWRPAAGDASGDSADESLRAFRNGDRNPADLSDTGAYELALSGSKSLAVTAGDGGALGVDAALYVNVNGQVAENVWIEGTLSDQNTPVQPEGNTTTLREVDEKYLRVYGRRYEYLLGDHLLEHGREGEDRYSIRAEGARLRYGDRENDGRAATFSFARSKGLYHSDTLRGVDGKQHGYYLRGRDGSTFITVLAGTERLWRNGAPLRRGIDYVIDYAQGRVDFLSPVWVTGENLFSAEFQYSEDAYPRIVIGGEAADTLGAFRVSLRAIQEAEDERNPAAGSPDDLTLATYRQAGDGAVTDSLGAPVNMPARRAVTVFSGEWEGGEGGRARVSVLGSLLDRNLYSGLDDDDNLGWSSRYRGEHRFGAPLNQGGFGRVIVEPEHEHRSRDYASFRQLIEPRAFRDAWNLDAAVGERDFDANRLRLTLEPYTGWQVGGEAGYASGRIMDTAATTDDAATSRRGALFARAQRGASRAEASAEAKRARDPLRRDNDRQSLALESVWAGWLPRASVLRDAWWTELPGAGPVLLTAETHQWQPRVSVESPALGDLWVWTPESDALVARSNYGGRLGGVEDSVIDIGVAQRLRLLGWGPVTGEVYAARRHQRAWLPDGAGDRSLQAETAVYDQAEANLSISDYLKGYGLNLHYRAARTAETPLVESYAAVEPGRGDHAYDSVLNTYYEVETGGDYVLVGLVRDSTLGEQPYQDLQWSLRLELAPGKWPAPFLVAGGILRDIDLSLDMETDHQDSAADALPLPRFTDAQIEAVRSGRARYEPSLRWTHPEGGRSGDLRYRREYAKGAGLYAYRERATETRAEYRRQWSEVWEGAWIGAVESRWRQSLAGTASGDAASRTDAQRAQMLLYRRFPFAITAIPSLEYRHVDGEDAGFPLDLHGVVPRARLEKGGFFGGRASAEYGVHWLFGRGEGGYFVTEGYRRGVTHRFEAVAQSAVQTYLHLNANYLARLEPGASSWSQRFSAEVRAVF